MVVVLSVLSTIAAGIWLLALMFSQFTAWDIAATPQPNQAEWVAVADWLPAAPVAAAVIGWVATFVVTRRVHAAVLAATCTLLSLSVAVVILVLPKAP
jgi:hypothetical protein